MCSKWETPLADDLLLLHVCEALLSSLQTFQIFHHPGYVEFTGFVLGRGKPAASHSHHHRHDEQQVLHVVMRGACGAIEGQEYN